MNKRAQEMWEQIIQHVDFTGKTVIDLGCGTGDFLYRSLKDKAAWAIGVELDPFTARQARETCKSNGVKAIVLVEDIQTLPEDSEYDIAMCFSVLPYVRNQVSVLKWMKNCAKTSIIEMQYAGDGPGPANIVDDLDMINYLNLFWSKATVIGRTDVTIRQAFRTIWLCEN